MNRVTKIAHDDFEELILLLRSEGHGEAAQRLHALLHEVAWTTGSEMTGELGVEILKFQRGNPSMSPALQELLRRCMGAVKQVWPDIEKARST
jgi:hypothetical protein